jgi:hypothetical protein
VLLSLFADAIVPPEPHADAAVPCSDKRASISTLASMELAWTFYALRTRGCIRLEPYEKSERVLFRKHSRPSVRAILGGAAPEEGLEAELLQAVGRDPAGSDVSDVVIRWIGKDDIAPFAEVMHRVLLKALGLGYYQVADAHRGFIGRIVRGKTQLEPAGEAIGAARPAFDACLAQWQRFESAESDLHTVLIGECKRGIESRRKADSDYSSFD